MTKNTFQTIGTDKLERLIISNLKDIANGSVFTDDYLEMNKEIEIVLKERNGLSLKAFNKGNSIQLKIIGNIWCAKVTTKGLLITNEFIPTPYLCFTPEIFIKRELKLLNPNHTIIFNSIKGTN